MKNCSRPFLAGFGVSHWSALPTCSKKPRTSDNLSHLHTITSYTRGAEVFILKPVVEKRKGEQAKNIHFNRAIQGKNSIKSHRHPKEPLNSSARKGKLHHSLQSASCLLLTPGGLGFSLQLWASVLLAGLLPQAPLHTWQQRNAPEPCFRSHHTHTDNPTWQNISQKG